MRRYCICLICCLLVPAPLLSRKLKWPLGEIPALLHVGCIETLWPISMPLPSPTLAAAVCWHGSVLMRPFHLCGITGPIFTKQFTHQINSKQYAEPSHTRLPIALLAFVLFKLTQFTGFGNLCGQQRLCSPLAHSLAAKTLEKPAAAYC